MEASHERLFYRVEPSGAKAPQQSKTVIGRFQEHKVREGETFLDIARHYHLGYKELLQANPEVDPWVPPVGLKIKIPSVWIFPRGSRRGLVLIFQKGGFITTFQGQRL